MKELELILQAVTNLGAAGKEAFIWWLIMGKGLTFIWMMTAVFVVAKVVVFAIKTAHEMDEYKKQLEEKLKELSRAR